MPRYLQWLTVPVGSELRVVAVSEILFLEADGFCSTITTAGSRFSLLLALEELRRRLDPQVFWPISSATVINITAIDTLYRSFMGTVSVRLRGRKDLLVVSPAYAHRFEPD